MNDERREASEVRDFEAVIEAGARGGAGLVLPFAIEEVWGARRVKIRATFDGVEYRGSAMYMGGRPLVGITKAIREAIGKQIGDTVRVSIERDTAPRTVDIPEAFATALAADPSRRERFDALAYTHRKEYARWIGEAKRESTRERRIAQALVMIDEGRKLS